MVLIKPQLRLIEKNKLYLSRRPGFTVWILFVLTSVAFVEICHYYIDNVFFFTILFIGLIIYGLDVIGIWEDIMLDRKQNIAIVTKYVWSEKLFLKNLEKSLVINLNDIRHVGASSNSGIFFLIKTGKTITFNTSGLTRDEIQNMIKKIIHFLEANRICNSGPYITSSFHNMYSNSRYKEQQLFNRNINFASSSPMSNMISRSNEEICLSTSNPKRLSTSVFKCNQINKTNDRQRNNKNHCLIETRSKLFVSKSEVL